jgi:peptide chain release factor 3
VMFETAGLHTARWVDGDDPAEVKRFVDKNSGDLAYDHDDLPVFLARNAWHLQHTIEAWPNVQLLKTREQTT